MKDYLNRLKNEKNLTNQQIANLSGVSLSTVNRIMSGAAKNPSHEAVTSICTALGGDMQEMAGDEPPADSERLDTLTRVLEGYEQQFEYVRAAYEAQLKHRDRWIRVLAIALTVLVLGFISVLLVDLFNPNVGWIRDLFNIGQNQHGIV